METKRLVLHALDIFGDFHIKFHVWIFGYERGILGFNTGNQFCGYIERNQGQICQLQH